MPAICVYCSSSKHVAPRFFDTAEQVGTLIAQRAGTLVFGGNDLGMMKAVADATRHAGGKVIGITPQLMVDEGTAYDDADELVVTETMRQRKQHMEQRADAFLTLPGGFGTLEELFETLTHRMLGYHDKPIVILNAHDYYTPLIKMFEHVYAHRFAKNKWRDQYTVADTPQRAIDHLLACCV